MNVTINGEQRVLDNVHNVQQMLEHFKIDHKILVVELNRAIIERTAYAETQLSDGDKIEIVHFVGGG
jgi:sulfur carrier protein